MTQEEDKGLPRAPAWLLITSILIIAAFFISVIWAAIALGVWK